MAQRHHGTHGVVTVPRLSGAQGQIGFGDCKDKTEQKKGRKNIPSQRFQLISYIPGDSAEAKCVSLMFY